jgi:small subunit ribosomal protein S6
MKKYELALILNLEAGEEEKKAKKFISEILSSVKGKLIETKILGVRELAYPIKKLSRGCYGFFMIEVAKEEVAELDKLLKAKKEVIRYLLLRVD